MYDCICYIYIWYDYCQVCKKYRKASSVDISHFIGGPCQEDELPPASKLLLRSCPGCAVWYLVEEVAVGQCWRTSRKQLNWPLAAQPSAWKPKETSTVAKQCGWRIFRQRISMMRSGWRYVSIHSLADPWRYNRSWFTWCKGWLVRLRNGEVGAISVAFGFLWLPLAQAWVHPRLRRPAVPHGAPPWPPLPYRISLLPWTLERGTLRDILILISIVTIIIDDN